MPLSPAELEITQVEYEALIWVRDGLAEGRFTHVPRTYQHTVFIANILPFNMQHTGERDCGTSACIGGWMGRSIDEPSMVNYMSKELFSNSLKPLFYPPTNLPRLEYSQITPTQAAQACDNFLNTGKPNWEAIL